jgi:HrpA-like RNA helicase
MTEKDFDYQKYRRELTTKIKTEPDKEARRKILQSAQETKEYQRARLLNQKAREKLLEERETELPILRYAREIKEAVSSNQTVVIVGETGSGKTTRIPLLLKETMSPQDKVAITQPRRVAARSVARYVAENVGCRIGEEVGYQIRFEDHATEGTRINFMTDGILLRQIQEDPLLSDYSAVIVDEAHERSLNIDFILGLLKRLQRKRAESGLKPIKIIVASATLEKDKFARYFDESPVVEVPGRPYPVVVHYEQDYVYDYTRAAAEKAKMIVEQNKDGDVLIFMPGQEEIDETIREIESLGLSNLVVLPLYGQMSSEEQDRIFEKTAGRKIIVATNIAETSVTVPGVRHVIDSGLIKQIEFDPSAGIEILAVRPHAKSGCIQRAGRAGRLAPGECWRLYSESEFNNRPEFQTPEIQRSNLAHVVLMMKKIGIEDVKSFEFIDPPKAEAIEQALDTLKTLGALDENERITGIGETMAELPLEPHIARMVIEAEKQKCVETICAIASFLGGRSVFVRPRDKGHEADAAHSRFRVPESDFLALLKVWQEYEANDYRDNWARDNFLSGKTLNEVRQVRYQLLRALRRNGIRASESQDPEAIGQSIAAGLIENLMEYYSRHSYRRVKDSKRGFFIHPSSATFGRDPKFFVPAEIVQTTKTYARIIQEVKPEWIPEIAPQLTREELRQAYYDPIRDRAVRKVYIYLRERYDPFMEEERPLAGEEAARVFAEALSQGKIDLPFARRNKEIIETVNDLWRRAEGKLERSFSTENLKIFYSERLGTISSRKELEAVLLEGKIKLEVELDDIISPERREEILRGNPDAIEILGASRQIQYSYDDWGKKFTASVKISADDILKLEEAPVLPSGRVIVFEVIGKEGENRAQFSGVNLEELKQKSRQFLIKRQWDEWRYREKAPQERRLETFDPLGELPDLPQPVVFGFDPETGEQMYAFPAITVEPSYYSGNQYSIKYFPSREEAQQAQAKVSELIEKAKAEQRKKEETERLIVPARELLQKVKANFSAIGYDYIAYGLSYSEGDDISNRLRQAERKLESDTKESMEILRSIDDKIEQALVHKEQKILAGEQVDAAIRKHYEFCPLCGQPLRNRECSDSQHDAESIDFGIDAQGQESGPAILSQIITDQGKIAAQLRVSHGEGRKQYRRYRGDVYLVGGSDIRENGWQGEPFISLTFEDFGKILAPDQVAERKARLEAARQDQERDEARARYQEDLEYAKQYVEQGYWRQGKFTKGTHPKSGEEQWELTLKSKGLTIKYVVDRWSRQPTMEGAVYFYSERKTIVDTSGFRLILVRLENPFPEDKPEEPELSPSALS